MLARAVQRADSSVEKSEQFLVSPSDVNGGPEKLLTDNPEEAGSNGESLEVAN